MTVLILKTILRGRLPNTYPGKCLPAKLNTIGYLPGKILVHKTASYVLIYPVSASRGKRCRPSLTG